MPGPNIYHSPSLPGLELYSEVKFIEIIWGTVRPKSLEWWSPNASRARDLKPDKAQSPKFSGSFQLYSFFSSLSYPLLLSLFFFLFQSLFILYFFVSSPLDIVVFFSNVSPTWSSFFCTANLSLQFVFFPLISSIISSSSSSLSVLPFC